MARYPILATVLVGALLAACAPPARPPASGAPPAAPAAVSQPERPATSAGTAPDSTSPADPLTAALTLPWDELHQRALTEGGTLTIYTTMTQDAAEKIFGRFEQRFPGIKVEQIDAASDRLVARAISEARGGKTYADVLQAPIDNLFQANQQGLLFHGTPLEAAEYPEDLRGPYWNASDLQFMVVAWNTNLVRPENAPRTFDDVADPRWRGQIITEERDIELLIALSRKHGGEEQGLTALRRIAANEPEFHKGHSELAELLIAGQGAVCLTCYSHHLPPRMKRGAPIDYSLDEGVGLITATSVLKQAPHPYTAMLWHRWRISEEGQRANAEGGRTPAHPNVAPLERTRTERTYAIGTDELPNRAKIERQWKEVFQLR